MTEKTIAKFKYENSTYKLLELTNTEETQEYKRYLCNSVGGFKLHLETGEIIPVKDQEVEIIAERYNLKKDNENYYYYKTKENCIKINNSKKYLIVKNRKRLTWTMWEGVAKQKLANLIAGELLQTKIQL